MSLPLELLLHGHGHGHGHFYHQLSIIIKLQPIIFRCSAHPIPNLRLVKTTVEDKNDELGGFRRPKLQQLLIPPSPRRRRRQEQGSSSSSLAAVSVQGQGRRRGVISAALRTLDLTEDNVKQVLADARDEFGHLFDDSVGMTGKVELAEVDGPFVKISLRGRFWHKRSTVLDRFANYLKQRIPEILEVDIEDEKQLDDSPENF